MSALSRLSTFAEQPLDLSRVPFSAAGSYLSLVSERAGNGASRTVLRWFGGYAKFIDLLELVPLRDGAAVALEPTASAAVWQWKDGERRLEVACGPGDAWCLCGVGLGVRMQVLVNGLYDHTFSPRECEQWLNLRSINLRGRLRVRHAEVRNTGRWNGVRTESPELWITPEGMNGTWEAALSWGDAEWEALTLAPEFVRCGDERRAQFREWLRRLPPVAAEWAPRAAEAAYIQWSSIVSPRGNFRRDVMLMSKAKMGRLWCWDNCFNALALSLHRPRLAWDQFVAPFDRQREDGALPDAMNPITSTFNFGKPPVQGWALRCWRRFGGGLSGRDVQRLYPKLALATEWWLRSRDFDGDGVPNYIHGNECWDNATIFADAATVESPDLATYLILQCEELSQLATTLGKSGDAARWVGEAARLQDALCAHSWRGDHFVATASGTHRQAMGDSLVNQLPLLLGARLPDGMRRALVRNVLEPGRFFLRHGWATESRKSPLYAANSYWRGPLWAPVTLQIVEGLLACGEEAAAREGAERFCRLVAAQGCAENFDPETGQGWRDLSYTWTASVFLLLARWLSGGPNSAQSGD